MTPEVNDEKRLLNHDIRNQLSNIIMTVTELKYMDTHDPDSRNSLYKTIEICCRNIENLISNKK